MKFGENMSKKISAINQTKQTLIIRAMVVLFGPQLCGRSEQY
jgi:hypothetical protein